MKQKPQATAPAKTPDLAGDFLDIDQNRLDWEWTRQPRLFMEWSTKAADARRDFSQAKADMDLGEAEIDQLIRANPDNYDMEKVTEPSIKQCILTQRRYIRARDKMIVAKHTVDVLEAAVNALDHKKKGLEDMVRLFGMQYFAAPKANGDCKEVMDNIEKRAARSGGRKT